MSHMDSSRILPVAGETMAQGNEVRSVTLPQKPARLKVFAMKSRKGYMNVHALKK